MRAKSISNLSLNHSYYINSNSYSRNSNPKFRSTSARNKFLYLNTIETIKKPYKIIYTKPNNKKSTKGMGKNIDKEE